MITAKRILVANATAGTDFDLTTVGLKFIQNQIQEEMEGLVEVCDDNDESWLDSDWDYEGWDYSLTQTKEEEDETLLRLREEERKGRGR